MRKRDEGPKHRELPILPALRVTIDATKPTGLQTYLVTEFGKPFTANGFGNKFRDWCDATGLKHCFGTRLAQDRRHVRIRERGGRHSSSWRCTAGAASDKRKIYIKRANRRRLARISIHLVALPGNDRGSKVSTKNPESVSHREKDE